MPPCKFNTSILYFLNKLIFILQGQPIEIILSTSFFLIKFSKKIFKLISSIFKELIFLVFDIKKMKCDISNKANFIKLINPKTTIISFNFSKNFFLFPSHR